MTMHTQCRLAQGTTKMVSWIPSDIAKVGNTVSVKDEKGWDRNWIVEETFSTIDTEVMRERSQDYKKTRKASDV